MKKGEGGKRVKEQFIRGRKVLEKNLLVQGRQIGKKKGWGGVVNQVRDSDRVEGGG